MAIFRTVLFWLHLAAGVTAGAIVLIMSATGVLLTYEKQMLEWADQRAWSVPPSTGTTPLPPETLLARVREARPEAAPTTLTLRADPMSPATVNFEGGAGSALVDPYTGEILPPPSSSMRSFFRTMTNWHRWLAMEGEGRATGKAITGAANLLFLFIVLSGIYLWVPRIWNKTQFRNVLLFRGGLSSKARDFNWHNVIGIWSAIPLAIVVAGAVPISYPWASNLVYRLAGEEPPAPPQRGPAPGAPAGPAAGSARAGAPGQPGERPAAPGPGGPRGGGRGQRGDGVPRQVSFTGLDAGFSTAVARVPEWRSINVRIPDSDRAPLAFTIDEGYGGQPQKRGTLTLARATGEVERWETFGDLSAGRRARSWLRFAHTGEYYGLTGQTIAGVVSAGGVVLVWTGIALAWRRFRGWIASPRRAEAPSRKAA